MSAKHEQLRALARFCRAHGGRLAIISQRSFDDLFEVPSGNRRDGALHVAPFTDAHGIHWKKKIVYAVQGREKVGAIIHEMGHVFADAHHPMDTKCREWSWLGWEIALARKIDAMRTWSRQNSNYATGDDGGADWGSISSKRRRAIVIDRLREAKEIGVVSADDIPRSVR
jgi:hypothetical protein